MSGITTHVLDTAEGRPAAGITVRLSRRGDDGEWRDVGSGRTNDDGRAADLLGPGESASAGTYRLRFDVGDYFAGKSLESFYPWAEIVFRVSDPSQHYHVPLLLSPFGYSTYRGS